MSEFTSKVVSVGFSLKAGATSYYMEKGTAIDEIVVKTCRGEESYSGTLVGVELKAAPVIRRGGMGFDGIPVQAAGSDGIANIVEAGSRFGVSKIALGVTNEEDNSEAIIVIPVEKIVSISGTFVDPEGNVVESVNLEEQNINDVLAELEGTEGTVTLSMGVGEVADEVAPKGEVTFAGARAGQAQNFDQGM